MYAKVNDNVVMFKIRNVMRLLQYEVLPLRRGFINWFDKSKQNGFIPGPCQGNINEVGSVSRCLIIFFSNFVASSEYMNIEHVFSRNMFLVEALVYKDKIKNETIDLISLHCVLYKFQK